MKKRIILNFIKDEKFIDAAIVSQDLASKNFEHRYIIISNHNIKKLQYIKNTNRIIIKKTKDFYTLFDDADVVAAFLHALDCCPIRLIPKIPPKIKVFWFAWGYDIYERPFKKPLIQLDLFHPLTSNLLNTLSYSYNDQKISLRDIFNKLKQRISQFHHYGNYKSYLKAVGRADYFSGVLPNEYNLIKKITDFKAQPVNYKYSNPENWDTLLNSKIKGNNILIGNSASPTNNHLDVFERISTFDLLHKKIIVPLSYGGKDNYVPTIIDRGTALFGEKFVPLVTFMPIKEYTNIVESCDIAIFLTERQQALGNILMMLLQGCKVFLSEKSLTYKYYKSRGVVIFSIQQELTQENIDKPLSEKEKLSNRLILTKSMTKDEIIKRMEEIYDLL